MACLRLPTVTTYVSIIPSPTWESSEFLFRVTRHESSTRKECLKFPVDTFLPFNCWFLNTSKFSLMRIGCERILPVVLCCYNSSENNSSSIIDLLTSILQQQLSSTATQHSNNGGYNWATDSDRLCCSPRNLRFTWRWHDQRRRSTIRSAAVDEPSGV
jgi:hypothetical protein